MSQATCWSECGRVFDGQDLGLIRQTVAGFPGLCRSELVATVCEHLGWFTAAGTPKITACRRLLERLEGDGLIELPALRALPPQAMGGCRAAPKTQEVDWPLLCGRLADVAPITLEPTTTAAAVREWNAAVERHHRLGYRGAFGFRLRYFIRCGARPLGCVLLSGAARALAVRDQWIGWERCERQANLSRVVNNSRFLIFPEVRIPHLASHVLGQLARRVGEDWERRWGFRPLLLETFVDPRHYRGTCYRAAGWELLGATSGRGLARPGRAYASTPRLVFVKALTGDFRQGLRAGAATGRAAS
jgi:hypothetical protein